MKILSIVVFVFCTSAFGRSFPTQMSEVTQIGPNDFKTYLEIVGDDFDMYICNIFAKGKSVRRNVPGAFVGVTKYVKDIVLEPGQLNDVQLLLRGVNTGEFYKYVKSSIRIWASCVKVGEEHPCDPRFDRTNRSCQCLDMETNNFELWDLG